MNEGYAFDKKKKLKVYLAALKGTISTIMNRNGPWSSCISEWLNLVDKSGTCVRRIDALGLNV